ncbi:exodeoxyribonuclease VII large subunit, partial [Glaesserella parasuis]
MKNHILTISQLNYSVKQMLEVEFGSVWLIGEISNFSQPVSGHWYLTLKDEQAQVRCAMFRMKNMRVNFRPQNGMQVLVRANVSLYEPRGDYQVIIETMQPAGDGLLQQQFEQLKMKLAGLGLFAQEHKKPIPTFVKRVGIVTSSSGAALQDILHILQRRDPTLEIVIYPTLVQGKEATADIVQMIELANRRQE